MSVHNEIHTREGGEQATVSPLNTSILSLVLLTEDRLSTIATSGLICHDQTYLIFCCSSPAGQNFSVFEKLDLVSESMYACT